MLNKIRDYIEEKHLEIFDFAIMGSRGIEHMNCRPSAACHENYSITKMFITTAMGILYDRRQIDLDMPLIPMLKRQIHGDYDPMWETVTIRHALMHKMGLDRGVLDIDRDNVLDYGTDDFLEYILRYPPVYTPGTRYLYTDVPHYLLARALTEVTGMPGDDFLGENLLGPLGFRQAAWSKCPMHYLIGSSGSYMRTDDVVKLGWLYLNRGIYENKRLLSEEWIDLTEKEEYLDAGHVHNTSFIGKAGMNGQMVMYSRKKNFAVAWHGYEAQGRDRNLITFLEREFK